MQERLERADDIRGAPETLVGKTATGTLTTRVEIVDAGLTGEVELNATAPSATGVGVEVEFGRRRASLLLPSADATPTPITLFSEDVIYQRRLGQAGGGTTEGRAWVKLRLQDLYNTRANDAGSAFGYADALNPAYLVDLLGGALSGSVELRGIEEVNGVRTRHFELSFGLDRAFDDALDRRREGVQAGLALLGASYTRTVEGDVWLDDDGQPRRIKVAMRSERDGDVVLVHYTLDLTTIATEVAIHLPKKKEIATAGRIAAVLLATSPLSAATTQAGG